MLVFDSLHTAIAYPVPNLASIEEQRRVRSTFDLADGRLILPAI
jgi:hypothetical protein